ncbi:hypothetical protein DSL72_008045 [Monilinia vaccinii-corymbosi]|uniref:Uncharacterized protein n=1 Tax=Monilinia vaccinii-corymbosi TaxID=61207 RepID=A0A8A3PIT8_9HELO|nr:hypothetical protein DSL72_008045 [Monilinia vaccinii-corymbosi]
MKKTSQLKMKKADIKMEQTQKLREERTVRRDSLKADNGMSDDQQDSDDILSMKEYLTAEARELSQHQDVLDAAVDVFNLHKQRFWEEIDEHDERVRKFEDLRAQTMACLQEMLDEVSLENMKLKKRTAEHEKEVADFKNKVKEHDKAAKAMASKHDARELELEERKAMFEKMIAEKHVKIQLRKLESQKEEQDFDSDDSSIEEEYMQGLGMDIDDAGDDDHGQGLEAGRSTGWTV